MSLRHILRKTYQCHMADCTSITVILGYPVILTEVKENKYMSSRILFTTMNTMSELMELQDNDVPVTPLASRMGFYNIAHTQYI